MMLSKVGVDKEDLYADIILGIAKPIFVDNGDNTITEQYTGLIWGALTVASNIQYDDAIELVSSIGSGWRLPTRSELLTIAKNTQCDPAIDTTIFSDTSSTYYWTCTPCKDPSCTEICRWVVNFYGGDVQIRHPWMGACVRVVRDEK